MVGLHQGQAVAHLPDQRDAGLAQSGLDDDAGFVEHGAEVGHDGLAVGGGAQAGGGDLFQPLDQGAEHVVLIVALNREFGGQAGVGGRGGGSEIADLVRDGADQDARGGHHRIEARRLRGRAGSRWRPRRRRPVPAPCEVWYVESHTCARKTSPLRRCALHSTLVRRLAAERELLSMR